MEQKKKKKKFKNKLKKKKKNINKKHTIVCKELLKELQKDETMTSKTKKFPKRFYGKMEALLAKRNYKHMCIYKKIYQQ